MTIQELINHYEKEVEYFRKEVEICTKQEMSRVVEFYNGRKIQLLDCIEKLKQLNGATVKRSELIKFLIWIDEQTYFKEDNDISIEFIVDEYQKLINSNGA